MEISGLSKIVIIAGDAHPKLADEIARQFQVDLASSDVMTFADGESRVRIGGDVRGACVVIVQPTSPPVNNHLITLSLLADAAKAAGARHVMAVVPYFGYSRQEKRSVSGEARSARFAAQILGAAGVDQLLTLDLHAPALESAFPMPATLLSPDGLFVPVIRSWGIESLAVVSPDAGGLKRAQRFAGQLGAGLAVVTKKRDAPDVAASLEVLGDVRGRECVIVDDLASTGRTLAGAAQSLLDSGATDVNAVFTHPVLSEGALEKILQAPLNRLVTSDSIPPPIHPRLEIISTSAMLTEAIREALGSDGQTRTRSSEITLAKSRRSPSIKISSERE